MQERKRFFSDTPFLKAMELPLLMLVAMLSVFLMAKFAIYVMPILIALVISLAVDPLVRLISGVDKKGRQVRTGLPRKLSVLLVMLVVFSLLILCLFLIFQGLLSELVNLADYLPKRFPSWMDRIDTLVRQAAAFFHVEFSGDILAFIQNIGRQLMQNITSFASSAVGLLTKLPSLILFTVFTIMSTYFWSTTRLHMMDNLRRQLPQSWQNATRHLYATLLRALVGWLKAQLVVMSCMFVVMFIGFTLLGIRYALLLSMLIALMDSLPILGSGLAMIPWAGYNLFFGSLPTGIGLGVVYVCLIFTRQSIEPRMVGKQIGLPPLWTMCAMYAGLKIYGFIGLFLGPLTLLLMYNIAKMYLQKRTYREVIADVAAQWSPPPDI